MIGMSHLNPVLPRYPPVKAYLHERGRRPGARRRALCPGLPQCDQPARAGPPHPRGRPGAAASAAVSAIYATHTSWDVSQWWYGRSMLTAGCQIVADDRVAEV